MFAAQRLRLFQTNSVVQSARLTSSKMPSELDPTVAETCADAASSVRASPQDMALVVRLLAGDDAAFTALVEQYHGMLIRLALVYVSSRAVAEEVVQETWVGVLHGLASFEGRSSLKAWIFRILTNRAKTRAVREGRSIALSALANPDDEREPAVEPARFQPNGMWATQLQRWDDNTPEKLVMQQEALRRLEQAIGELPPNQRAVVMLRDIDGLAADEVRSILGISETNQRVLLHRARSRLRSVLEEYVDRK